MVNKRGVALGLMLLASAGASDAWAAADWKAANQAMGKALEAGDNQAAYAHSQEALRLYREAGAPSEEMLVNLAINMADMAGRTRTDIDASLREIKAIIKDLKEKGPASAKNRLYLHNVVIDLSKARGYWADAKNEYLALIAATEEAFGPDSPELALVHIEYARQSQMLGRMRSGPWGNASGHLKAAERIAGKLPPANLNRLAILRMLAIYDIEGRRHDEAVRRLEGIVAKLSPDDKAQAPLWHQTMGTLAATLARMGEQEKADAAIARIIANTQENPEPKALVMWSPDPLEDWNEDRMTTSATAHFDIGPDGRAQNIRGELISGNPQYPAYVVEAMKKWRWVPVIHDGVPEVSREHSQRFNVSREREARTGSRLP